MEQKFEKITIGEKISVYLESWRTALVALLVIAVAALIAYAVTVTVLSKGDEKGLAAVDAISYNLTNDSADLSEEQLEERRSLALSALAPYVSKGRVTGVRANMLAAEIAHSKQDYNAAASYWLNAAAKGANKYTAPLAYFNAASCFESLDKPDEAEKNYAAAAAFPDFAFMPRALFELGRVREKQGNSSAALEAYKKLFDKMPEDSWAMLAKSRILALDSSTEKK